jgi:hypothetical protein
MQLTVLVPSRSLSLRGFSVSPLMEHASVEAQSRWMLTVLALYILEILLYWLRYTQFTRQNSPKSWACRIASDSSDAFHNKKNPTPEYKLEPGRHLQRQITQLEIVPYTMSSLKYNNIYYSLYCFLVFKEAQRREAKIINLNSRKHFYFYKYTGKNSCFTPTHTKNIFGAAGHSILRITDTNQPVVGLGAQNIITSVQSGIQKRPFNH